MAQQAMDNYYDFDDIPVPQEMELQGDGSFILETPTKPSGVMIFKGKVEIQSLRNYYINNMARENWTMRSAIKSSRTILVFEKPGRYCIITMIDGQFSTQMEIWVTPHTQVYSETLGSSSSFKDGLHMAPQTMDNYYDFDDIPVPQEMELQGDGSFILETPTKPSGVMIFKGMVKIQSLCNYYINNMARKNWTMRSAIKSSRTILVFEKPGRYCIITMFDGQSSTQMEVWVTPHTQVYSESLGSSSSFVVVNFLLNLLLLATVLVLSNAILLIPHSITRYIFEPLYPFVLFVIMGRVGVAGKKAAKQTERYKTFLITTMLASVLLTTLSFTTAYYKWPIEVAREVKKSNHVELSYSQAQNLVDEKIKNSTGSDGIIGFAILNERNALTGDGFKSYIEKSFDNADGVMDLILNIIIHAIPVSFKILLHDILNWVNEPGYIGIGFWLSFNVLISLIGFRYE